MKSWKHVFDEICDPDNLDAALRRAVKGRRSTAGAATWLMEKEKRLFRLREELLERDWTPAASKLLFIRDPKPRTITVSSFEEHLVHHALCRVVGPRLERSFIFDTYACLKDRGSHRAVLRLLHFMRCNRYVMQLDLRKYFASISHHLLLSLLERTFPDGGFLWLCETLLMAYDGLYQRPEVLAHLGDPTFEARRGYGLPIGSLTSQVWGNVYLNSLDHFIKRELKVKAYCRYMDDLTLLGDNKHELEGWRKQIEAFLREVLELSLRSERTRFIPCTAKVDYLGYRVSRAGVEPGREVERRLSRRLQSWLVKPPSQAHIERSLASVKGLFWR